MSISQMEDVTASLSIPAAPELQAGSVKAWSEPVMIQSYALGPAERNPIFLDDSHARGVCCAKIDRISFSQPSRASVSK